MHTGGVLEVNNAFTNYTAALRLDFEPIPDLAFTLTGRYINSVFQIPTEGAGDLFEPFLDPHQSNESSRFVGSLGVRYRQAPWLEHRFKIGGNTETARFGDPVDVPPDFPGADTIEQDHGEPPLLRLQRGGVGAEGARDRADPRRRGQLRGRAFHSGQSTRRSVLPIPPTRAATPGPATASCS